MEIALQIEISDLKAELGDFEVLAYALMRQVCEFNVAIYIEAKTKLAYVAKHPHISELCYNVN